MLSARASRCWRGSSATASSTTAVTPKLSCEKLRLSGWGEYKIRTALQRKRIDRELIDAALAQADRQDMAGRLRQQLERKMRTTRHTTQYELKTKLIRYGLSLGYDYETVLDSAAALVTDTETCDEF